MGKKDFSLFQDPRNSEYINKNKIHPENLAFRRKLFDTLFFQKISFTLSLFVKDEHHMEVTISSSRYNFQFF